MIFILLVLTSLTINLSRAENATESENRFESARSLFTIVTFKNLGCRSQSTLDSGSSPFRNGTCYTSSECTSKGGTSSGPCAAGFGVCCIFLYSASGSTINQNCSYIRNPDFPSSYSQTTALSYTIQRCSSDICYIRLDFETFTLRGPSDAVETAGGACVDDTFTVTTNTGTATSLIPVICGMNSGHHIYFDIGTSSTDTAKLDFKFAMTSTTRKWDIKVSQIECSNAGRPPNGCLQYYTTLTGRLTTFNFLSTTTSHLANQKQHVCIRRAAGFCCVQYQVCPNEDHAYTIVNMISGLGDTGLTDELCIEDFVEITGSAGVCSQTGSVLGSRFCGQFFSASGSLSTANAIVCDCTAPFSVLFQTNNLADALGTPATDPSNRGVCLDYSQVPCTSA